PSLLPAVAREHRLIGDDDELVRLRNLHRLPGVIAETEADPFARKNARLMVALEPVRPTDLEAANDLGRTRERAVVDLVAVSVALVIVVLRPRVTGHRQVTRRQDVVGQLAGRVTAVESRDFELLRLRVVKDVDCPPDRHDSSVECDPLPTALLRRKT